MPTEEPTARAADVAEGILDEVSRAQQDWGTIERGARELAELAARAMIDVMSIGEALNRRSDLQKRIMQRQDRLRTSVLVQEGDEPPESPQQPINELDSECHELQRLIAQINHTNAATQLPTGETVTEGLARRDVLELRQSGLRAAIRAAMNDGLPRYSRSEIRMVRQIRVREVQAQVAHRAQRIRHPARPGADFRMRAGMGISVGDRTRGVPSVTIRHGSASRSPTRARSQGAERVSALVRRSPVSR